MSRNINVRKETVESTKLHNEINSKGSKIIITNAKTDTDNLNEFAFVFEDGKLVEIRKIIENNSQKIIQARIKDAVKSIDAYFIETAPGEIGFIKTNQIEEQYLPLKQGDLLPVKLIKEASKGKREVYSNKIDWNNIPDGLNILEHSKYKSAFTVLYQECDKYRAVIKDYPIVNILTDSEYVKESLSESILYSDTSISLNLLYGLNSKLNEALTRKINMKSGAYLVLDTTEALTVFDVNTGKYIASKNEDQHTVNHKINKEAIDEVIYQCRLRNLSGMILVDLAGTNKNIDRDELLEYAKTKAKQSNQKLKAHDITELGILEFTRQKTHPPLYEQVRG